MKRRTFLEMTATVATAILLRKNAIATDAQQRLVAFDVATTGLNPHVGHRIFEMAAVEIHNSRITGATFHSRFDPERELTTRAEGIFGCTRKDLSGAPKFGARMDEFLAFLNGSRLVIHNVPFDLAFLHYELDRLGKTSSLHNPFQAIDTLCLARSAGIRQLSLPKLCERFAIPFAEHASYDCLRAARAVANIYLALTVAARCGLPAPRRNVDPVKWRLKYCLKTSNRH